MNVVVNLIKRYQAFIAYGIFGVLTTIINIVVYNFCYNSAGFANTFSNIVAWMAAVIFAYFTNKIWVFQSKSWEKEVLLREISAFVSCRIATGILDLIIMFICVDVIKWHAIIMKLLSNVLVIILNYIFSKLVIFKKK